MHYIYLYKPKYKLNEIKSFSCCTQCTRPKSGEASKSPLGLYRLLLKHVEHYERVSRTSWRQRHNKCAEGLLVFSVRSWSSG
jgi:hypothetical protein